MKLDEFAFVNLQLAGMLKCGIPLEGALKQLCATMRRGGLRSELEQLEADLARGVPLPEALGQRKLPEVYVRLMQVGVASNDLPAMLTLLADHYQRMNNLWTRLKGLMVYPVIVLVSALLLSIFLAVIFGSVAGPLFDSLFLYTDGEPPPGLMPSTAQNLVFLLMPVLILTLLTGAVILGLSVPRWRRALLWRLPGFKEASLSRFASALGLLLRHGCTPSDALGLLRQVERGTSIGTEVHRWESKLAEGRSRFEDISRGSKVFPPLFLWLVASGEDWVKGFARAAEIYQTRAAQRIDMMLYAALPVSILLLGLLIVGQVVAMMQLSFGSILNWVKLIY
jgi:type II secretory pathway component PulF